MQRRIASTAVVTTAFGAKRNYEYWGLHTSPRAQPSMTGDKLSGLIQLQGISSPDLDGQYLTGNGHNVAWNADMLTDRVAENHQWKKQGIYFRGIHKYVLDPVTAKECELVSTTFSTFDTKEWFAHLFRDYPNLAIPLGDQASQDEFKAFYAQLILTAHDEAATLELVRGFVPRMFESKHLSQHYWWRIAESLMATLEQHHIKTSQFSGRQYGARAVRVVVERGTKILFNQMTEWNFASDDFVSPYKQDLAGHRATHEAGLW